MSSRSSSAIPHTVIMVASGQAGRQHKHDQDVHKPTARNRWKLNSNSCGRACRGPRRMVRALVWQGHDGILYYYSGGQLLPCISAPQPGSHSCTRHLTMLSLSLSLVCTLAGEGIGDGPWTPSVQHRRHGHGHDWRPR